MQLLSSKFRATDFICLSLLKIPVFLSIVIAYHAYVSVIKSSKQSCTIAVTINRVRTIRTLPPPALVTSQMHRNRQTQSALCNSGCQRRQKIRAPAFIGWNLRRR